ncbi:hypothetical protein B1A_18477, partial [mine drainage metagenome]
MQRQKAITQDLSAGHGLAILVDVETTGLQPDRDEIVELALVLFAFQRPSGN